MKKTVVIGASPDPQRYSHRAVRSLISNGTEVIAVGKNPGRIGDVKIHTDFIPVDNVHTVTLYLHPRHQGFWKDYIFSLDPKRVIFNPGTENPVFEKELKDAGITPQQSCTLVMLSVGTY